MTKTFALLLDSYRELNAKRLFWVTLFLSGLVVAVFFVVGIDKGAFTFFGWRSQLQYQWVSLITPALFYKVLFVYFGIGFWLSWIGCILALVSTAGIFPDLIASGSIDLYLSKPIARLRLFVTKFVGGLLFVTLQVGVFAVASFLLLGLRGKTWEPSIFLAVPLVVLMFSYLFAICILLGVMTRSTIAALLLTLLIWFGIWGTHLVEALMLRATIRNDVHTEWLDKRIAADESRLSSPGTTFPVTAPAEVTDDEDGPPRSAFGRFFHNHPTVKTREQVESELGTLKTERSMTSNVMGEVHAVVYGLMTALPKTSETTSLLDRQLLTRADLPHGNEAGNADEDGNDDGSMRDLPYGERRQVNKQTREILEHRSIGWVIGTSAIFETLVLGLAAWIFCRRDY